MLSRLHIRNLAVLDEVETELRAGFNALTGETGAGKSMLVDALALALGSRADSGAVRSGAEKAEVTAVFDLDAAHDVRAWLCARDLDGEDECQLRRVITAEGRSRGYINGQPVPLEQLRELGSRLVEICGQHAHQSLLARAAQRDVLDAHGRHGQLVAEVADAWARWQALETEHRTLLEAQADRLARRELLAYQIGELRALALQPGEIEALEQEQVVLANAGRIRAGVGQALDRIYDADEGSAHALLGSAAREITALAHLDPALAQPAAALAQVLVQVADTANELRHRLDALEHDPGRQDAVESRLAAAQELARRQRSTPEALWQRLAAAESELGTIDASDERLGQIAAEAARQADVFAEASGRLHRARCQAADSLATAVTANLRELGMPGATFRIHVEALAPGQAGPSGTDLVEFQVTTGAGQPPGPMARIASGGELSRLSLAIQAVAMAAHGAPTLVFDEVDAGIGGGVAEIVGQSLRRLSTGRQVLCVTHLAQVASQADHHFAVSKVSGTRSTRTGIRELTGNDRVEEIARMLGGVTLTERTRAHAREMLASARPRQAG